MSQSKSLLQKSDKLEDAIRNHLLPSLSFGITDVNLWCGKIETQTKRHKYFPWKMNIRLEDTFMLKKQAFDFWKTYIEFLTKGMIDVPMPNPAIEFLADVKAGKYDEISDEEYDELLNSTAELASFWKKKRKATVGEIVREALIHMNLSLSETEKLAQILAEASTCKTYK